MFNLNLAEMWFGIVFAVLVEIVPMKMRSSIVGIFMFFINNIGGNLPIIVDPIAKHIGYRESISIFYAGFYGISESHLPIDLNSRFILNTLILFK